MVETMDVEEPQSYSKNINKRVKKNQPKTRPSSAGSRRRRTKRNKNKYKIINTIPALNNNRTKSYSYNKYERKSLENGWNSLFAQNQTENKHILENIYKQQQDNVLSAKSYRRKRPKSASQIHRNSRNNQIFSSKPQQKRVVFRGGSNNKNVSSKRYVRRRRPKSAGYIRRNATESELINHQNKNVNKILQRDLSDTLLHQHLRKREYEKLTSSISNNKIIDISYGNNKIQKNIKRTIDNNKSNHKKSMNNITKNIIPQHVNINTTNNDGNQIQFRFEEKCKKIRSLWKQLHIPTRDRRFFSRTFMLEWTDRNEKFIDEQLELLLTHHDVTVEALRKMKERENAIYQLNLITKAASLALIKSRKKPLANIQHVKSRKMKKKKKGKYAINTNLDQSETTRMRRKEKAICDDSTTNANAVEQIENQEELLNNNNNINNVTNNQDEDIFNMQVLKFHDLIADRCRRAQLKTIEVIDLIKIWRSNLWRPQPFKWRGENYVLRIGNCHGLHFVQETDVIDALKLCNIKSKDLMLLLPSHIRDLICTQNGNNNNNNYNNNDNIDNKKETNSNEVDGQDYQLVKSKALCDCEEFVRREQILQEELGKELKDLLTNGFYIPQLKWNPNKLQEEENKSN